MIKLRAIAYPPDPAIPSLLHCPDHWIGWAGKTASRNAMQKRIQRDVKIYGVRGVLEATVNVDLTTSRSGQRMALEDLLNGKEILNFERVTAECRDWVLNRIGLLHEADFAAALTSDPKTYVTKLFNIREIQTLQCVIWLDFSGECPASYGALRDLSRVIDTDPKRTPSFYPVTKAELAA
jgi:hypothetical protein